MTAPAPTGRPLLLLLSFLAVGAVTLAGLPSEASDPRLGMPSAADLPGAMDNGERLPTNPDEADTQALQRLSLRSVSTAPVRPRLGDAATGAEPEPVERHTAVVRLDGVDVDALEAVRAQPGVAHVAALDVAEIRIAGGDRLTVALVDPAEFRPLTPRLTAEDADVWTVLAGGELLLSPDRAAELRVRAGGQLRRLLSADLPVGGTASNGAPPVVDAIASREIDLGRTTRVLLVATTGEIPVPELAARLAEVTGVQPEAMPAHSPSTARLVGTDERTVAAFSPFTFTEADGGRIAIDPAWEEANIVRAEVPILGTVRCHRLLMPQLTAALQELVDRELAPLIDPNDYGGCYLPRHIDWSPAASLSMHAWGVAIDLNVSTNWLGAAPQLDPRVVEVFTAHGFSWGGDWRRPDGMHFELAQLLDERELAALTR